MPDPTRDLAAAEVTVRRLANQPKNKPLLVAFNRLLNAVRHGSSDAMTVAEAAFWEAMEERDASDLAAAVERLEVWRALDEGRRSWQAASPDPDHGRWTVVLWWLTDDDYPVSSESPDQPTLLAAVEAALRAAGE